MRLIITGPSAVLAAASLFAAACAPVSTGQGATTNAPQIETGRQLAGLLCARCHAIGFEGASPNALAPPFRLLGQKYGRDLADVLSEAVVARHPIMPTYRLSQTQVAALTAYLQSIQAPAQS